jgi:hypothetical protein
MASNVPLAAPMPPTVAPGILDAMMDPAALVASCPKPRNMRFWIVSGVCLVLLCALLLYLWLSSMSNNGGSRGGGGGLLGSHATKVSTREHRQLWVQQSSISGMYQDPDGNMIIMVSFRNGMVCISKVTAYTSAAPAPTTQQTPEIQFSLHGLPAVQMNESNRFTIPDRTGTLYFSWDGEHVISVTVHAKGTTHGDGSGKVFVLNRIPIVDTPPV